MILYKRTTNIVSAENKDKCVNSKLSQSVSSPAKVTSETKSATNSVTIPETLSKAAEPCESANQGPSGSNINAPKVIIDAPSGKDKSGSSDISPRQLSPMDTLNVDTGKDTLASLSDFEFDDALSDTIDDCLEVNMYAIGFKKSSASPVSSEHTVKSSSSNKTLPSSSSSQVLSSSKKGSECLSTQSYQTKTTPASSLAGTSSPSQPSQSSSPSTTSSLSQTTTTTLSSTATPSVQQS